MVHDSVTGAGQKNRHGAFSYSLTISHILVKLKHHFKYCRMWHFAQIRHLFQQNVMFWTLKKKKKRRKKNFQFLKKACGHEDESVGLSGYCMWSYFESCKKLKILWKKSLSWNITLMFFFAFVLFLSFHFSNHSVKKKIENFYNSERSGD